MTFNELEHLRGAHGDVDRGDPDPPVPPQAPGVNVDNQITFNILPPGSEQPVTGAVEQDDGSVKVTGEMAELVKRLAELPDDAAKDYALTLLSEGGNVWHKVLTWSLYKQGVQMSRDGHIELHPIGGKHVADQIEDWVRREYIKKLGTQI